MRLLSRAKAFIKRRPAFSALLLILAIVSMRTIHPHSYIVGWDNFSSYFNLKENIFRTLFATWREYRGLGVPSDSENVDIFRQLFYAALSPFLPMQLWEQCYILTCLIVGVIAMYIFVEQLLHISLKGKTVHKRFIDISASTAAFLYFFNLNSISTFYFPMVMFVSRFSTLPILFLIGLRMWKGGLTRKNLACIVCLLFFTSTTYLVATIFITTILAIGIYMMSMTGLRKSLGALCVYVLLMSFWLLPFLNYTVQKSPIIPKAPTFIETNEIQLNKPKEFFGALRQLSLYPTFFDTTYTQLSDGKVVSFYDHTDNEFLHLLFPVLYILGSAIIILRYRTKSLVWIPIVISVFVFLSLKEYSPLGFLYTFFGKTIPYFKIIFRFGDTKFHAYIAFAGSIAASIFVYHVLHYKRLRYALVLIPLSTCILFLSTFSKGIVGEFMFNKIPSAYFDIAKTINNDPHSDRVLHMPLDKSGYWKSYQWGAFGSSFFNFMIDRPLVDRTFEPGSMENAYVDNQVRSLTENVQALSEKGLQERAEKLSTLLKKLGVGYVVMDGTVSSYIPTRNMLLWGKFNTPDAQRLTNALKTYGFADSIHTYNVDNQIIELLKIRDVQPLVSFVQEAQPTDPHFDELLQSPRIYESQTSISSGKGAIYPFFRRDAELSDNTMTLSDTQLPHGTYRVGNTFDRNVDKDHSTSAIRATITQGNGSLKVDLYNILLPNILDSSFAESIGSVTFSALAKDKSYIVKIGDSVVGSDESVLVKGTRVPVSLLELKDSRIVPSGAFKLTDNPNCYSDAGAMYSHSFSNTQSLDITSRDGSTCVVGDLSQYQAPDAQYVQLMLRYSENSEVQGELNPHSLRNVDNPTLAQDLYNMPSPTNISVCMRSANVDECLNPRQNVTARKAGSFTFSNDAVQNPLEVLSLRTQSGMKHSITFNQIKLDSYKTINTKEIAFEPRNGFETIIQIPYDSTLSLSYPHILSKYSAGNHNEAFLSSQGSCPHSDGLRFLRTSESGQLYSYMSHCQNDVSFKLPFDSDNFYVWSADINLMAGKYPKFLLEDKLTSYVDEFAGIYLGYPEISGFKSFALPESVFGKWNVDKKRASLQTVPLYTLIYPHWGLNDRKSKDFTIHEDAENEAIMLLGGMSIQALPNTWQNMYIAPENGNVETYQKGSVRDIRRLLPSMWKVNVDKSSGEQVIRFNMGFDAQWGMYGSLADMLVGRKLKYELQKCDGFAQCYKVTNMPETFYFFYNPERLALIGLIMSLSTVIALFFMVRTERDAAK